MSLVAQTVKNLPAMQEMQVRSLGQEDPLEKKMVTHSRIFAWRIPCTEEPDGLQSTGWQRVGHNKATNTFTYCFSYAYVYVCVNIFCLVGGLAQINPSATIGSRNLFITSVRAWLG